MDGRESGVGSEMSIVQLVDIDTGQTLVRYVMASNDPTDDQLDAMETVVEYDLLRSIKATTWCRHNLVGGCDVCDR